MILVSLVYGVKIIHKLKIIKTDIFWRVLPKTFLIYFDLKIIKFLFYLKWYKINLQEKIESEKAAYVQDEKKKAGIVFFLSFIEHFFYFS